MPPTASNNNSTVMAACAALAVTAATAAIQKQRNKVPSTAADANENDDATKGPVAAQPIWRESQVNDTIRMTIETQGSTDSTESMMESPVGAEPTDEEDVIIKPTATTSTSFHVKDICMIAAWVACVAAVQWTTTTTNNTGVSPSAAMTTRHITDDLVHQCIGETTETEEASVTIDTPIFLATDSTPQPKCWIPETRVEPSNGMYGPTIGADSLQSLVRLHQTDISELAGVYGSLVVDAPFELQLKSVALEEFWKKHDSKVDLPQHGVYGSFLAPNEAQLQSVGAAVQTWLDNTMTIDTAAVYGAYVNFEGLNISPGLLEAFAELQTDWSLHQQAMIHL